MTIDIHRIGFNDQAYVKRDDHEAAIRIQAARSEAIGIQACMTTLRGLCHVWGMSHGEIERHGDFKGLLAAFAEYVAKPASDTANPCEDLARAGWKFSTYDAGDTWQVWAKHPLGGAKQIAILVKANRNGFDAKATAEAFVELLSRKGE